MWSLDSGLCYATKEQRNCVSVSQAAYFRAHTGERADRLRTLDSEQRALGTTADYTTQLRAVMTAVLTVHATAVQLTAVPPYSTRTSKSTRLTCPEYCWNPRVMPRGGLGPCPVARNPPHTLTPSPHSCPITQRSASLAMARPRRGESRHLCRTVEPHMLHMYMYMCNMYMCIHMPCPCPCPCPCACACTPVSPAKCRTPSSIGVM